jgi:ABC-type transporter MlaC component
MPGGVPNGGVFSQPAFAAPNPRPLPLPPPPPKRGKGWIGVIVLLVAALIAVGLSVFWPRDKVDMAAFCGLAAQNEANKDRTAADVERNYTAMRKVAPRALRPHIDNELAFMREQPELSRVVYGNELSSMSQADREQFLHDFGEAMAKYKLEEAIKAITNEIARCPEAE